MSLLELSNISKAFHGTNGSVQACSDISLHVLPGEVLGLVGESGSGKSTLASIALALTRPDAGSVAFEGTDLTRASKRSLRSQRRHIQAVFQQPLLALNSRRTVGWSIAEPLMIHGIGDRKSRQQRVAELLSMVGLEPEMAKKLPKQLSGGQLQRVNIARALALEPKLLICDEPVSALDASVQAQVINVFLNIQRELKVALLFISHDLAVVRHLADRIAVMYAGRLLEVGTTEEVCSTPRHPYTKKLLMASGLLEDSGENSQMTREDIPAEGCVFAPRCQFVLDECRVGVLDLIEVDGHRTACRRTSDLFT